jgi:hypothetical protein
MVTDNLSVTNDICRLPINHTANDLHNLRKQSAMPKT